MLIGLVWTDRNRQRLFNRPPCIQAMTDTMLIYACSFTPHNHRQGLILEGQKSIATTMPILFYCGKPATIVRAIPQVVNFTFNGIVLSRSLPHVSQKVIETIPTLTDGNAFGTVPFPGRALWVFTAITHGSPRVMCQRFLPNMHMAMTCSRRVLALQTALVSSFSKFSGLHLTRSAALTLTDNELMPICRPTFEDFDDGPFVHLFAN